MRNQYEYELGLLTGMNEAIMNQNDQMRDRILQQNAKIQEVRILMVEKYCLLGIGTRPFFKGLIEEFRHIL